MLGSYLSRSQFHHPPFNVGISKLQVVKPLGKLISFFSFLNHDAWILTSLFHCPHHLKRQPHKQMIMCMVSSIS